MRLRLPFSLSTIRGQITAIILFGLVIIVISGSLLEQQARYDYAILDVEKLGDRVLTISSMLETATPGERETILEAARRTGWDMSLQPLSLSNEFTTSSPREQFLDVAIDWLFPPDEMPPPLGGWKTFLNGSRVIAVKVDEKNMLLLRDLPNAFFWSEVLGRGSHYLVALITLIILFSFFAVWAITQPLRRIASAAINADVSSGRVIFEERGSVEIVALARALNGMSDRIATMIDGRMRMLRAVSHDLRTPLTRLRLRAERVSQQEVREMLLADIAHINSLLKESLSYLRDEHQRETTERADIASVLQTICSEFNDIGHNITYSGPNRLITNFKPLAMTRAITNLCENAVKFGNNVVVALSSSIDSVTIEVADDGPGISKDDLPRVLEPFYKASRARGQGDTGFGLGLSIVSEIVQAHQGRIELVDRQPNGLIARLTIPRR